MLRCVGALALAGCWASHGVGGDRTDPTDPPAAEDPSPDPEPEPVPEPARPQLRIAFLVDSSQSMAVSDPASPVDLRTRVQHGLDGLVDDRLPESFLLVATSRGQVTVLTQCDQDGDGVLDHDCFTNDELEARLAIDQLVDRGGLVDSWAANLSDLDAAVRADVEGQASPRTSEWVVLFVTDEGGAATDDLEAAAAVVAALRADVEALGSVLTLSVVVLDVPFAGSGTQVASRLADAGGGSVLRVAAGDPIDFEALLPAPP